MAAKKSVTSKDLPPDEINFGGGDGIHLPPAKDIHEAIVLIMAQVGYVQKREGGQLSYKYAGEAQLIAAIRPWMVFYGVHMSVVGISGVAEVDRDRVSNGKVIGNTRVTSLTSVVRFTHAPSGSFHDVVARGEGADVSDKANNKAQTGAYKYALRQTFCIETGNDPDDGSPLVPGNAGTAPLASAVVEREAEMRGGVEPPEGPPFDDEPPHDAEPEPGTAGAALGAPPAPPAGTPPPKLARIDITDKKRRDYEAWVKRLIVAYPAYSLQKQGEPTTLPDFSHIRATAAHLGFALIDDASYQTVFTAIVKHAKDKAVLYPPEEAEPGAKAPAKAPAGKAAGGPAKRPTNDEALKKAGFN